MVKKILWMLAGVLLLMGLSACGGVGQSLPALELPEDGQIQMNKMGRPDTLEGLCEYLADGLAFAGDPVEMSTKRSAP